MWKTLGGHCIYHAPSGARVYQNQRYRWLTFNSNALQSLIYRRRPEKPLLGYIEPLILAARYAPGDTCLLGLGGAAVPHALIPHLKQATLTAIDNNRDIIYIASTYFGSITLPHLNIVHAEASQFLAQTTRCYPHLLVDLFDAHMFPSHCNTYTFFSNCLNRLEENGILALNIANGKQHWPIISHIRTCFLQKTVSIPIKNTSNVVVLAYKGAAITPLLDILHYSRRIKTLSWDAAWGCIAFML